MSAEFYIPEDEDERALEEIAKAFELKRIARVEERVAREKEESLHQQGSRGRRSRGGRSRGRPGLFLKLSNYTDKGTRIVSVDEFVGEYSDLVCGNGLGWARRYSPFANKYKCVTLKANGELNILWEADEKELNLIERDFSGIPKGKGNKITHIKLYGSCEATRIDRSIPKHVREHFKDSKCVVCGNSAIEIDHKNGLYNYEKNRVLQIEDFQPLCMHCNQQKRQSIVLTKETGKRYKATIIPQLKVFGVDFTQGDETYDPNDPNAMVGTYWYDPVDFLQRVKLIQKGA